MNGFLDSLRELHPWLPGLFRLTVLLLAVFIVWILVSGLFYALRAALVPHLEKLAQAARAFGSIWQAQALQWFGRNQIVLDRHIDQARWRYVFDQNERKVTRKLSRVATELGAIRNSIERHGEAISRQAGALQESVSKGADHAHPLLPDIHELDAEQLRESYQRYLVNRSYMRYAIVSLIVLIPINTMMLEKFFGELIGAIPLFAGISMATVLALLFTGVEVLAGVALYWARHRVGHNPDVLSNLGLGVLIIVIACLAGVEAYLYFLVSLNYSVPDALTDLFASSPEGVPLVLRGWMSIFGPTLVLMLAFAGHMMVANRVSLFGYRARTDVGQVAKEVVRLKEMITDTERHAQALKSELENRVTELADHGHEGSVPQKCAALREDWQEAVDETLRQRGAPCANVPEEIVRRGVVMHAFLFVALLVVMWVFAWNSAEYLSHLPGLQSFGLDALMWPVALAQAFALLYVSQYLDQRVRIVVQENSTELVSDPGSWVGRLTAWGVVLGVGLFSLWPVLTVGHWHMALLQLICVLFLVYTGRHLGHLLFGLGTLAQMLMWSVLAGVTMVGAMLLKLGAVGVSALHGLIEGLAELPGVLRSWLGNSMSQGGK